MESGHAYGKALRTVKSCVGSDWCRYGQQDSVQMAIDLELRYRGLRAPHKIKMGVSGCARECAEARGKDVGVIATETGWNLYVGGNGGMTPQHAQLLAGDLDDETLVRYIDRFLMFYIRTADRLQRTAPWVESLEGGLEHLRESSATTLWAWPPSSRRPWPATSRATPASGRACSTIRTSSRGSSRSSTRPTSPTPPSHSPSGRAARCRPIGMPAMPVAASGDHVTSARRLDLESRLDDRLPLRPPDPVPRCRRAAARRAQVALFRLDDGSLHAVGNIDPFSGAAVMSRGIVGDRGGRACVQSPIKKQAFALRRRPCLDDPRCDAAGLPDPARPPTATSGGPPVAAECPNVGCRHASAAIARVKVHARGDAGSAQSACRMRSSRRLVSAIDECPVGVSPQLDGLDHPVGGELDDQAASTTMTAWLKPSRTWCTAHHGDQRQYHDQRDPLIDS